MNNIQKFYNEHRAEIVIVGTLVGAAVIGGVLTKSHIKKSFVLVPKAKSIISWTPTEGGFMDFERAKEILELNKDSKNLFAMVKEGSIGKDIYQLIGLNGSKVITK